MGLWSPFSKVSDTPVDDAPQPFSVCMNKKDFVDYQVIGVFSKVLMRTLTRVSFTAPDQQQIINTWSDSFSGDGKGLVTFLAEAMNTNEKNLGLIYEKTGGVLRRMTNDELSNYQKLSSAQRMLETGKIVFDFSNFKRAKVAHLYFDGLFYLNQIRASQWGVAGITVLKAGEQTELDKMTNQQARQASEDASRVAKGISTGKMVWLAKGSELGGAANINADVIKYAREDLFKEMSMSLNIPYHFLTGEVTTGGIGDYSEADLQSENELLRETYFAIIQPCMNTLYGVKDCSFIDDRWRTLESRTRTLSMLEASEFWSTRSPETKESIWAELLNIGDSNLSKN